MHSAGSSSRLAHPQDVHVPVEISHVEAPSQEVAFGHRDRVPRYEPSSVSLRGRAPTGQQIQGRPLASAPARLRRFLAVDDGEENGGLPLG